MRHIRTISIVLVGVFVVLAPGLRADSLQLKNGNFVQGKYLGGTERAVQFEANGKIRLYGIDEILSISFAPASADGSIPSNDDEQKLRTSTGLNFIVRDSGGFRTATVSQANARKPLSKQTTRTESHSGQCRHREVQTVGFLRSNCTDLAPKPDSKARIVKVSAQSTRVLAASYSTLFD